LRDSRLHIPPDEVCIQAQHQVTHTRELPITTRVTNCTRRVIATIYLDHQYAFGLTRH